MTDAQPRWFAGRKVTACRECPYMRSDTSWHYCGALHAPNETGVCPESGVRSDCQLPVYEEETIVGVSPARLRQLERREAALKRLAEDARRPIHQTGWEHVEIHQEGCTYGVEECPCCCGRWKESKGMVLHAPDCVLAAAIEAAQEEDEA